MSNPDPIATRGEDRRFAALFATVSARDLFSRRSTGQLFRDPTIQQSYRDPSRLRAALLATLRAEVPALRSQPGSGIDLFFDLCLARPDSEQPILRWYSRDSGWQLLHRAELRRLASRLAARWQHSGALPGTQVAIVAPAGPELFVGLLAAFQLGLVATVIPPSGRSLLDHRLRQCGCQRIAALPLIGQLLREQPAWQPLLLPPIGNLGSGSELLPMQLYPSSEPATMSFSLLHDQPEVPLPLSAEQSFWGALRDGLLVLGLRPGDALCCLGGELLQYQPALLLTALLCGATYVHIDEAALAESPQLLRGQPLRALLLSHRGAALLAGGPQHLLGAVQALYCDVAADSTIAGWRRRLATLGELPPLYVYQYDSAAGGMTLCSGALAEQGLLTVLPAPAMPYALTAVGVAAELMPPCGLLRPLTQPWGSSLVFEVPDGLMYLGTLAPRRGGHSFPESELLAVLTMVDGLDGAALVALPPLPSTHDSRFHLLLFCGATVDSQALARRVALLLHELLPPSHHPDELIPLPLYARRKAGQLDVGWVRSQYLQGALVQKASDPLFQLLAALRGRLRAANPSGSLAKK